MTEASGSNWVDAKQWKDRWTEIGKLHGGGQGQAFRATRLEDGSVGFLKVIKSHKDQERRMRFYREASAYDTFRVDGIPRMIESNAHWHGDLTYKPYLVTEFIEGPTLRAWREAQASVSLETACSVANRLLNIVEACHGLPCVHRDIKPENIILQEGDADRVWLLDFGLNYHDLADADFQTEDWQEIGNRFLRLPELSAGSKAKQDPRSDISFVGGILFYLLTGEHPDVLHDAEGRMPHQRSGPLAKLQSIAPARIGRLAVLFDNCFAPRIDRRFSNSAAMRSGIADVLADSSAPTGAEDNIARIQELLGGAAALEREESSQRMATAATEVRAVFNAVSSSLGSKLVPGQTAYLVEVGRASNTIFWNLPGTNTTVVSITYEIVEAGDELLVFLSGETVYRTSLSTPDYGEQFRQSIRDRVTARILAALEDPNSALPEADHFREVRPHSTLTAAGTRAAETGRHILAFVYDPAAPQRGRLGHALMYFLHNRKTRDAMSGAFVTALVPLAQLVGITDILDGKSMDEARWVMFDSTLQAKEEAIIYANPRQGEVEMERLVQAYPPK